MHVLTDIGAVKVICVDAGRAYYDTIVEPHSHIICKKCKRIVNIMNFEVEEDKKRRVEEEGHRILDYSLNFFVVCRDCLKEEEGKHVHV